MGTGGGYVPMVTDPKCIQVGMLSGGKWDKLHDISRRVYSGDGVAPTIHTSGGGQQEPKIVQMAHGFNKGSVQENCPTITSSKFQDNNFVAEPQINVVGNYSPSGHDASRVVDTVGIAPTVKENHGTVTAIVEPKEKAVNCDE